MKYLGIDYGTRRIGLALSDESASFAFPHRIVPTSEALATIVSLCAEEKIGGIVVGESRAINDEPNPVAHETKKFVEYLQSKIDISVVYEREGFSSVEAYRYQEKRGHADDSAAAIILQRFLDKQKK